MGRIKLSIVLITYNHEKYIRESIESIIMQDIPFSYEVLIGEDCSVDSTPKILRDMLKTLPSNFHIFFRKENMGMNANLIDLIYRARGDYMIILEGDDYWLDRNKLKKQVEFLENNSDYVACSHRTLIVDENSESKTKIHIAEKRNNGDYTFYDFRSWKLPGQTTTILMRNVFKDHLEYKKLFVDMYPGDRTIAYILLVNGKIFFFNEKMSAYRLITKNSDNFSATVKSDYEFCRLHAEFLNNLYVFSTDIGLKKKERDVLAQLYFRQLFRDSFRVTKCMPNKSFVNEFIKIDCKMKVILWILLIPILTIKEIIENNYWKF